MPSRVVVFTPISLLMDEIVRSVVYDSSITANQTAHDGVDIGNHVHHADLTRKRQINNSDDIERRSTTNQRDGDRSPVNLVDLTQDDEVPTPKPSIEEVTCNTPSRPAANCHGSYQHILSPIINQACDVHTTENDEGSLATKVSRYI